MNTLRKNKNGFTLTELIIVIVIIGILAGVLIPSLTGYVNKARISAAEQEANDVYNVYHTFLVEKDSGTISASTSFFTVGTVKGYYYEVTQNEITSTVWEVNGLDTPSDDTDDFYLFHCSNGYVTKLNLSGKVIKTVSE